MDALLQALLFNLGLWTSNKLYFYFLSPTCALIAHKSRVHKSTYSTEHKLIQSIPSSSRTLVSDQFASRQKLPDIPYVGTGKQLP